MGAKSLQQQFCNFSLFTININIMKEISHPIMKKQLGKKADLQSLYDKIVDKYEKQSSKVLKPTYSTQAFDDGLLSIKKRALPSLQIESRNVKRKFYSKKIILNDTIYVNQRKETSYHEMVTEFKKLSIPSPFKDPQLSDRNRRIKQLYERADRKSQLTGDKIKFTQKIENPKIKKEQATKNEAMKPIKVSVKEKKVSDFLKQAKERRQKLQLPHLRTQRSKSSVIISQISLQKKSPQKNLTCKKIENSQKNSSAITVEKKQSKLISKKKTDMGCPYKVLQNLKRPLFNWKKQVLPLTKISQQCFNNLIKYYLNIKNVNPILNGFYKAYIGSGNNSSLIRKCLKDRGHWIIVDSLNQNPHFVWTQLKLNKFYEKLKDAVVLKWNKQCDKKNLVEGIQIVKKMQLEDFQKNKKNEFLMGCQKILHPSVFMQMGFEIMRKFKKNENIKYFNQLKPELVRNFQYFKKEFPEQETSAAEISLHNHISNAGCIGDKKGLLYMLTQYCQLFDEDIDQLIPPTIHLEDTEDSDRIFQRIQDGPWILKPGESTNRGVGITIHLKKESLLAEIGSKKKKHKDGTKYTNIIQKYIKPLLYFNRKFDLRVWVLWNGSQAWWYSEGYVRTASKQFSLKNTNKFIHLTNDAIQIQCEDYGKFEAANKASFNELNKYLESNYQYRYFESVTIPQMKQLAKKAFRMSNLVFGKQQHSFELFGLDYLMDSQFKPWLIEFNTNPSLQVNCSLLARLIPNMINNVMNLTIDILFPPPVKKKPKDDGTWNQDSFKFELLFDGEQDFENMNEKLLTSKVKVEYQGEFQQQFPQD